MTEGLRKQVNLRVVASNETRANVLAVGDVGAWRSGGNAVPSSAHLAFVDFSEVSAELIGTIEPELVVSPLLAKGFDCTDLAHALHQAGFKGRYRALARTLPDPGMIRREISNMCPGLDFDIAEMPTERKLRAI